MKKGRRDKGYWGGDGEVGVPWGSFEMIVLRLLQINGSNFTNINPMSPKIKLLFSIKVKCLRIYLWNIEKNNFFMENISTLNNSNLP